MRNKFGLLVILFNIIFVILILSIYTSFELLQIKEKLIYIEDITKGIYFIFDKENIDYFKGQSYMKINNIDINIYENETEINQLIYYLNNIVNNNGIVSNLYKLNEFNSSMKEILDLSNKIYILAANLKSTFNLLNNDVIKYDKTFNDFLINGLQHDTNFHDMTGTGYRQCGFENPLTYLSSVNIRTRSAPRIIYEFYQYIECDESWNISIFNYFHNYLQYIYTPREQVLCEGCKNTCSSRRILLNYLEYSFDEIIERYSVLKDSGNNKSIEIYNAIAFEFTALEKERSDKIYEQIKKVREINSKLMKLQNNLYNELENSMNLTNEIINIYKKLFSGYANENSTKIYSFLDCEFIRDDINFILSEIENNYLPQLNKLYENHIILNIIVILFSFIFLNFYSITSYQPIKSKTEENINKIIEKEIVKKMKNKDSNKIVLANKGRLQTNNVYNTIIFKNKQCSDDSKLDRVMVLNDNNSKFQKSTKKNIVGDDIDNSKEFLYQ